MVYSDELLDKEDWGDHVGKFFGFKQCPSLFPAWHLQDGQFLEWSPGWDGCSWLDNYRALKLSPCESQSVLGRVMGSPG